MIKKRKKPEEKRLLKVIRRLKACTVNEAIWEMFEEDYNNGEVIEKGPFYYTHINKLPSRLQRDDEIDFIGLCPDSGEKMWVIL